MTTPPDVSVRPDPAIQAGLDATLQHIALLMEKQDRLRDIQVQAENQLLHRAAVAYGDRRMGDVELADLYMAYSVIAQPGYEIRWNLAIPIHAKRMKYILSNAPNGPQGTWRGTYPFAGGPVPLDGISVVYVLYDRESNPCYVGSTHAMRERFKRHVKDRKSFVRWTACRCEDRETAYQLEEKLLGEHKPYLNRKRGR